VKKKPFHHGANSWSSLRITEFHSFLSGVQLAGVKTTDATRRIYLSAITYAGTAERILRALNRRKNKNMDLLFCSNDHIEKDYR